MTIAVESVARVALKRVDEARTSADLISAYSGSEKNLDALKTDLEIIHELLSLIVPPAPSHDPA